MADDGLDDIMESGLVLVVVPLVAGDLLVFTVRGSAVIGRLISGTFFGSVGFAEVGREPAAVAGRLVLTPVAELGRSGTVFFVDVFLAAPDVPAAPSMSISTATGLIFASLFLRKLLKFDVETEYFFFRLDFSCGFGALFSVSLRNRAYE
jgi:hypothetical protein